MAVPNQLWSLALSVAIAAPCLGGVARAGEKANDRSPTVAELIKQLDADQFARREEASRRLAELGAAAVPELARAAEQSSLEVSTRAFAVLREFDASDNENLQTKARQALKQIASKAEAAARNKDESLSNAAATAKAILGKPFLGLMGNGGFDASIGRVIPGSAAEKAGLKPGDVVLSFAGAPTPTFTELTAAVGTKEPGDRARLEINRDGETMQIELTVGRYPNLPIASLLPEPDLWQPVEVQIEEELPEEK